MKASRPALQTMAGLKVCATGDGRPQGLRYRRWQASRPALKFDAGSGKAETMTMATVNNGVNVQALLDAREALKGAPEATQFTWRASCKWQTGTYSKTHLRGFFGLGQGQQHKTENSFETDHPEILVADGRDSTPIEYVLVGLASCPSAGVAAVAQNRGIQLRSVESNLEGTMDIRGILGVDSDVRNGYDDIKVTFKIDADASKEDIEALVAQSQKRSAVYDVITNHVNVYVEVVGALPPPFWQQARRVRPADVVRAPARL